MPVHHFYHIFADGAWQEPVDEHFAAAGGHGLLHILDSLQIGIVGQPERRLEVKSRLDELGLDYQIIDEKDEGFEQVTMNKLADFSKTNDGYVLFAHTKGAFNNDGFRRQWRHRMTEYNVVKWWDCIEALATYNAAGIHWIKSELPEHVNHNHFFAGTYWWSHLWYLRLLPYPEQSHRWASEGWIGLNESNPEIGIRVKDFYPGPV